MDYRSVLSAVAVSTVFMTTAAAANTLYVAGYGGSAEQTMRSQIIPDFEKAHGVKIEYIAGNSTDTLAKLQAQKGNQQIDVIIVDDGPMYQAIELGFCAPIPGLDSSELNPVARYPNDMAVAQGIVATGLFYNSKYFEEKGWAPPTSWNDLKDPKYKGMVVIPPMNNTYGLHTVLQFARLAGGGEKDIDPGFKTMIEEVNDNVLAYEPSPGKMTELFQSEQAVLGVWGSTRVLTFAATGFPAKFVYPTEGAVTLLASVCPVAKPDASPLAVEFTKYLVTPEIQKILMETSNYMPVNTKVEIPAALAEFLPVGERGAALYNADWNTINTAREDWTRRWNREVEK